LLIEANTADATLAQQVQGGSVANIDGIELTLLGAGRSLVNGAIPITFRAKAAQGNNAVPLAVGQPVTVLARLNTKVKGIVLPSEAVVRTPTTRRLCGSNRGLNDSSHCRWNTRHWTPGKWSSPKAWPMKTVLWFQAPT
jgi:hypothetical protein